MVSRCHNSKTCRRRSSLLQDETDPLIGHLSRRRRKLTLPPRNMSLFLLLASTLLYEGGLLRGAQATRTLTVKSLPKGLLCDFENDCEWHWPVDSKHYASFRMVEGKDITEWHARGRSDNFPISGPDTDKEGNPYGHFLYLGLWPNSTTHTNNRTQITSPWITSPWFERSGDNCRLEFDLHTKGAQDVQNLIKVLIIYSNNSTVYTHMEHKDSQNDSVEWRHKTATVGGIEKKFKLSIEVELSRKRPSHVAIDNIKLIECTHDFHPDECSTIYCDNNVCVPKNMVCDLHKDCISGEDEGLCYDYPEGARCNFENKNFCGWKNNEHDEEDWHHHQGQMTVDKRGPTSDHTLQNETGSYMLSAFPPEGTLGMQSTLESPIFDAPPCYHRDQTSSFYESCKIRLFYHKEGRNQGAMRLEVVEFDGSRCSERNGCSRSGKLHLLDQRTGDQGSDWRRLIRPMPVAVTHPYQVRVVNVRAVRHHAEMGLDDISLSPECFGIGVSEVVEAAAKCPIETTTEAVPTISPPAEGEGWMMTTCGASGREGPSVEQCHAAYKNFPQPYATVTEENGISLTKGLQKWRAPADGFYTIIAFGASGGTGVQSQDQRTRGSEVRGIFYLQAKDVIFIMVGQEGESACDNVKYNGPKTICHEQFTGVKRFLHRVQHRCQPSPSNDPNTICHERSEPLLPSDDNFDQMDQMEKVAKMSKRHFGGGGGGGGASAVFKVVDNKATPLVVAGGGGGLGWVNTSVKDVHNGRGINSSLQDSHGLATYNESYTGAGPGGGWRGTSTDNGSVGQSLLKGGRGGVLCKGQTGDGYNGFGGYGGGGGACFAGGGGGGYTGGNSHKGARQHGEGGTSFISSEADKLPFKRSDMPMVLAGEKEGDGLVYIMASRKACGSMDCDFECLALDSSNLQYTCICAPNWELDRDQKSCNPPNVNILFQATYLISIVFGIVVIILISAASIYCYNRYQHKKFRDNRANNFLDPGVQLRNIREGHGMLTEYNPNYEFGGSTTTIKELREIPRENLTLIKALGQGAFGEVYQGYLKHYAGDHVEMPVAVKTLPEMSTGQAEMDFLMEALIMSKFNHPNIVHFIGVCFDKLPRFIVLELLSGGDLKSFLREARPKPEKPSALTMKDLLTCAMDVVKGCEYLEQNHFIHRDIAARNCLLTTKGPGRVVKIADFGMARDIYRNDYYRKGGKAMLPVKWMPPEAFLDGIFTSKTDVWSFGVLLWEVMSLGYMPYPGRGNQDVMHLVTNGGRLEAPSNCPSPIYHIMTQCWHPIPDDRPTFATLLERLGYCVQDPDVLSHALPVFQRPPSTERDATVMRPLDSEACLQVSRGGPEAQSPGSQDYLIPLPSSYSLSTVRSELNSTPSLESGAGDCCQLERLIDECPPAPPSSLPPAIPPPVWETSFSHEPTPPTTQPLPRHSPPTPAQIMSHKAHSRTPTHSLPRDRGHASAEQAEAQVPLLRSSPPTSPPSGSHEGAEMPLLRRTASSKSGHGDVGRGGASASAILEGAVGTSPMERAHRRSHHYHPHRYTNSGSSNNSSSSSNSSNSSSSTAGGSSSSTLPLDPSRGSSSMLPLQDSSRGSSSTLPIDPGMRGSNSTMPLDPGSRGSSSSTLPLDPGSRGSSSNSTLPLDPGQLPLHIPPPLHYANVDCSKDRNSREIHDPYTIHETREHREISC